MPTGVYDRTKAKLNTGLIRKGEHRSPSTEIRCGQRFSPSTQFETGIGSSLTFEERNCLTEEWSQKQSESHKGQHSSPDTEIKRGQRLSPDTEFKQSVPGGVSTEDMLLRASFEYVQWRKVVFSRDDYTCQICYLRSGRLEAHHIKPFATHPELRLEIDNGITLCKSCHRGGDVNDAERIREEVNNRVAV